MVNQLNESHKFFGLTVSKKDWLTITFGIEMFLCHPIRKLLVSIKQSFHLIYSVYNISADLKSKERSRRIRSQMLLCFIFLVLFSKKTTFWSRGATFRKNCDNQGRARWYWYRWYCGNPKVFADDEELTRNINEKKKPGVSQAYRCSVCGRCSRWEYFFNKYVKYCESVK